MARLMEGSKFGHLTVFALSKILDKRSYWNCKCKCGTIKEIRRDNLVSGKTKSCGCYNISSHKTHGMKGTSTYKSWGAMKGRCLRKTDHAYNYYGAKGIKVCDRWLKFENFYIDMGKKPEGKTLDRINNNGNYELSNCRWADWETQNNNTSRNRFIICNGITLTISQWSRKIGIPLSTLYSRLFKYNWNINKSLNMEV